MKRSDPSPPPISPPEPTPVYRAPADSEEIVCRVHSLREFWATAIAVTLIFGFPHALVIATVFYLAPPPGAQEIDALAPLLFWSPLAGILCGGVVTIGQAMSPIRLSRRGIRFGNRRRVEIEWEEIVQAKQGRFLFLYRHCRLVRKTGEVCWLTVDVSHRPDFVEAVLKLAPKDNPLRAMVEAVTHVSRSKARAQAIKSPETTL